MTGSPATAAQGSGDAAGLVRLFAALPVAMLEFDAGGRLVRANPRAERLLGRPLETLRGMLVHAVLAETRLLDGMALGPDTCPVTRALAGEQVADIDLVLEDDASRVEHPLHATAAALHDTSGAIMGAVLTLSDVGGGDRVRDDLARSRARMAFALEAAGMVAWDWNPLSGHVAHTEDVNRISKDGHVDTRAEFQALIHPDDQARVREAFGAAFTQGHDYHCEYRVNAPDGAVRWIVSRGRVTQGPDGGRWMSGVMSDVTAQKRAEFAKLEALEALRDSEERLRLAVEGTSIGIYDTDLDSGEAIWSPIAFTIMGLPNSHENRASFELWRAAVHPEDQPRVLAAHAEALARYGPLVIEYRIRRADTGEERWLSTYGRIYKAPGGKTRSVGIVVDNTEKKRADERERLLMREVDHRAKNVLAVVQSILQLMPRHSPETFFETATGRIGAVARAHTLLADSRWSSASLRRLLSDELAAFRDSGRVEISGDDILLRPEAAQPVAMVVHELATNASKYGALADGGGRLVVDISQHGGEVRLTWRETVTHPISEPEKLGFGSRLIRQIVTSQLGGTITNDWRRPGLAADIAFIGAASGQAAPPVAASVLAKPRPRSFDGRLVLVVEDDAVISMILQDAVATMKGRVVALHSVSDALAWLADNTPAFALLDVNLHGILVTPVAEELMRRGVPIVYATGYSDTLADLPRAPVVRKPFAPEIALEALLAQAQA